MSLYLKRNEPVDGNDGKQKSAEKDAQGDAKWDCHEHTWIITHVYYNVVQVYVVTGYLS